MLLQRGTLMTFSESGKKITMVLLAAAITMGAVAGVKHYHSGMDLNNQTTINLQHPVLKQVALQELYKIQEDRTVIKTDSFVNAQGENITIKVVNDVELRATHMDEKLTEVKDPSTGKVTDTVYATKAGEVVHSFHMIGGKIQPESIKWGSDLNKSADYASGHVDTLAVRKIITDAERAQDPSLKNIKYVNIAYVKANIEFTKDGSIGKVLEVQFKEGAVTKAEFNELISALKSPDFNPVYKSDMYVKHVENKGNTPVVREVDLEGARPMEHRYEPAFNSVSFN